MASCILNVGAEKWAALVDGGFVCVARNLLSNPVWDAEVEKFVPSDDVSVSIVKALDAIEKAHASLIAAINLLRS